VGNFTANNWGRGPKEHDVPRNDWRQVTSLPSGAFDHDDNPGCTNPQNIRVRKK